MVYRCIGLGTEKALIDVFNQAKIEVMAISHLMGKGEAVLDTTEHDKEIRADERRKTITELEEMFLKIKYSGPDVFQFVSIDSVLKKLEQMKEQKNVLL